MQDKKLRMTGVLLSAAEMLWHVSGGDQQKQPVVVVAFSQVSASKDDSQRCRVQEEGRGVLLQHRVC